MKNKYSYFLKLKHYLVIVILLLTFSLSLAQDKVEIEYNRKEINACNKYRKSIPLLVLNLTKNKSSDKEKFDALFAWVALNIKYDYYAFYSSNGHSPQSFKRTLKKKKGICLDYAYLMDTLCKEAGINNYTIYGYAKDEIYDVNDSMFIDNHAWNAVRLDGEWYVYDVTWAAGQPYYDLSKFGKFIRKTLLKWPKKVKKIVKKNKFQTKYSGFCPYKEQVISKKEFSVIKYRFKLLRNIFIRLPFKYVVRNNHRLDTNFYLCQPEVLGITHFPDDATWSLTKTKTVKEFTKDSAFYYLDPIVYKNQNRQGVVCPDCDYTQGLDNIQTHINLLDKSKRTNPNNKFISFLCEYNISNNLYSQSVFLNDSAQKVNMLDSSIAFVDKSRKSLDAAKKFIGKDYSLQKNKNISKRKFLVNDNIGHRKYTNSLQIALLKKSTELAVTTRDINAAKNKYYHRNDAFLKLKTTFKISKTLPNESLNKELEAKHLFYNITIDSLNNAIQSLRNELEVLLPQLNDTIKSETNEFYIFLTPFEQKLDLRSNFYDDYKKQIVEKRDFIERYKTKYKTEIDSLLLPKVLEIYNKCYELLKITEKRSALRKDHFQILTRMVKCDLTSLISLENYKSFMLEENKEDLCWLNSNHFYVALASYGLRNLKSNYDFLNLILKEEYKYETKRFQFVHKELSRRLRKYKNINNHNRKISFYYKKMVRKEKQEYLKKLKKERQAAKKKSTIK